MPRVRVEFPNPQGERLAGLLETPPPGTRILAYALFAHCFTCGKDIATASRISRALAARGIAVLRFDFTGLGNSDGDFANTSFSSNVADLIAAADMLARQFEPPRLLIGHSLGGAAILVAAHRLPTVEALVTIAAPATATHVRHLFSDAEPILKREGEAEVRIGRRQFRIKTQFLEDLEQYATAQHIGRLRRALLLFHSPFDEIVAISEAFAIYQAARHPKSFISLDHADHLLSDAADAIYVADTMVAWASRYLGLTLKAAAPSEGTIPELPPNQVLARELGDSGLLGLFTQHHQLSTQPASSDLEAVQFAPCPADLLRMALAADIALWVRQSATATGLALDDVEVQILHEGPDASPEGRMMFPIRCRLRLTGALRTSERDQLCTAAAEAPLARALTEAGTLHVEAEEEP